MKRLIGLFVLVFPLLGAAFVSTAPVAAANNCAFVLGFKFLHDLNPDLVGDCVTSEFHNAANGDGLQLTTHGLLVWRKADNFTAFTDGSRTWLWSPFGLLVRMNNERYPFEADFDDVMMSKPGATGTSLAFLEIIGGRARELSTIVIHTTPGASCSISIVASNGAAISDPGLTTKTADRLGLVSWLFTVPPNTARGRATVTVTCNGQTTTGTIPVTD